jgi:hypothetical protein
MPRRFIFFYKLGAAQISLRQRVLASPNRVELFSLNSATFTRNLSPILKARGAEV